MGGAHFEVPTPKSPGKEELGTCLQSEGEGAWGGGLLKEEGTGDLNFWIFVQVDVGGLDFKALGWWRVGGRCQ